MVRRRRASERDLLVDDEALVAETRAWEGAAECLRLGSDGYDGAVGASKQATSRQPAALGTNGRSSSLSISHTARSASRRRPLREL
jgi:hypothetical protein